MSRRSAAELPRPSFGERVYRGYERIGFLPTVLVALVVLLALFVPRFLAVQNIFNVLRTSSYLVMVSAGQMLVLIVGGFDLSVGAVVALTSVVSPHFSNYLCAPLFTIALCFLIFSARRPARVFIQPGAGCLVGI